MPIFRRSPTVTSPLVSSLSNNNSSSSLTITATAASAVSHCPLSDTYRRLLQHCRPLLVKDLDAPRMLDALDDFRSANPELRELIAAAPPGGERAALLLDRLERSGTDDTLERFVDELGRHHRQLKAVIDWTMEELMIRDDGHDSDNTLRSYRQQHPVERERSAVPGQTLRRIISQQSRDMRNQSATGRTSAPGYPVNFSPDNNHDVIGDDDDDISDLPSMRAVFGDISGTASRDIDDDDDVTEFVDCISVTLRAENRNRKWIKHDSRRRQEPICGEADVTPHTTSLATLLHTTRFRRVDRDSAPTGARLPPANCVIYVVDNTSGIGSDNETSDRRASAASARRSSSTACRMKRDQFRSTGWQSADQRGPTVNGVTSSAVGRGCRARSSPTRRSSSVGREQRAASGWTSLEQRRCSQRIQRTSHQDQGHEQRTNDEGDRAVPPPIPPKPKCLAPLGRYPLIVRNRQQTASATATLENQLNTCSTADDEPTMPTVAPPEPPVDVPPPLPERVNLQKVNSRPRQPLEPPSPLPAAADPVPVSPAQKGNVDGNCRLEPDMATLAELRRRRKESTSGYLKGRHSISIEASQSDDDDFDLNYNVSVCSESMSSCVGTAAKVGELHDGKQDAGVAGNQVDDPENDYEPVIPIAQLNSVITHADVYVSDSLQLAENVLSETLNESISTSNSEQFDKDETAERGDAVSTERIEQIITIQPSGSSSWTIELPDARDNVDRTKMTGNSSKPGDHCCSEPIETIPEKTITLPLNHSTSTPSGEEGEPPKPDRPPAPAPRARLELPTPAEDPPARRSPQQQRRAEGPDVRMWNGRLENGSGDDGYDEYGEADEEIADADSTLYEDIDQYALPNDDFDAYLDPAAACGSTARRLTQHRLSKNSSLLSYRRPSLQAFKYRTVGKCLPEGTMLIVDDSNPIGLLEVAPAGMTENVQGGAVELPVGNAGNVVLRNSAEKAAATVTLADDPEYLPLADSSSTKSSAAGATEAIKPEIKFPSGVAGNVESTLNTSASPAATAAAAAAITTTTTATTMTFDREGNVYYIPRSSLRPFGDPSGQPWFFPTVLTPHQATLLVGAERQEGCFVVYRSTSPGSALLFLSVGRSDGQVMHYPVVGNQLGDVMIQGDSRSFLTVADLVEYFRSTRGRLATRLGRPLSMSRVPLIASAAWWRQAELDRAQLTLSDVTVGRSDEPSIRYLGTYQRNKQVEVKLLEKMDNKSPRVEDDFFEEARILASLRHVNVVRLIGISASDYPLYVVTEHPNLGDLREALRGQSAAAMDDPQRLYEICRQAAKAVAYLHSRRFVLHRCLAAQSFYVTAELDVKLGCFGRARSVVEDEYVVDGDERIWIKWNAPEVMRDLQYGTKSDIWSLAVVFWEVYSAGERPFRGFSAEQTAVYVCSGGRLDCPATCPTDIYRLMRRCWARSASRRPAANDVIDWLRGVRPSVYYSSCSSSGASGGGGSNKESQQHIAHQTVTQQPSATSTKNQSQPTTTSTEQTSTTTAYCARSTSSSSLPPPRPSTSSVTSSRSPALPRQRPHTALQRTTSPNSRHRWRFSLFLDSVASANRAAGERSPTVSTAAATNGVRSPLARDTLDVPDGRGAGTKSRRSKSSASAQSTKLSSVDGSSRDSVGPVESKGKKVRQSFRTLLMGIGNNK